MNISSGVDEMVWGSPMDMADIASSRTSSAWKEWKECDAAVEAREMCVGTAASKAVVSIMVVESGAGIWCGLRGGLWCDTEEDVMYTS